MEFGLQEGSAVAAAEPSGKDVDGLPLLNVNLTSRQARLTTQEVVSMTVPEFGIIWAVSNSLCSTIILLPHASSQHPELLPNLFMTAVSQTAASGLCMHMWNADGLWSHFRAMHHAISEVIDMYMSKLQFDLDVYSVCTACNHISRKSPIC